MVSFRPVFRNSRIFGRTPYILFDFQRCQPAIQTEKSKALSIVVSVHRTSERFEPQETSLKDKRSRIKSARKIKITKPLRILIFIFSVFNE
ncbi:hypothetical protein LEP1GSC103_0518 [Leptospira borgpetersenii serovar Javanica str. UI 09931]|uniref:Uncharacterized protein n=4 Tax=Leptospira borgpetersenii TaxID=174 RepID=A0A0E3BLA2_LEPBO|nr:hypothetical protein LBBP_03067 [Leptospira borgpetersenii serovar Ballum]AXX15198.1 hypothetical protein C4Q31_06205 [Leptospira borgpetersenii serovar Ceylonica]EKP14502.1 hypothetical protein LEP1GSC128_1425 [Leptospira borgpetersenii str. 200801926]EKQ92466.1 hypothetical protein LEP1GSC101_2927 [Leptospira borgpetersenii str. UI 09149]EKQ99936.1 hypothetical protein LEP1GSC121_2225 [Leptospira borgpetersenii serovar Castellonis str. 200801910]EMK12326.1 hypothetical protein LEP1GSC066_